MIRLATTVTAAITANRATLPVAVLNLDSIHIMRPEGTQASTVGQVDDKLLLPYAGITRFRFKGSTLTVLSAGQQPSSPLVTGRSTAYY